jgi:predicted MFS family arabinose efflux permease
VAIKLWPDGPLWRHGDFLKLWGAQSVSDFGARITREGLPLAAVLVTRATPAQLGILAALTLGPSFVVGLTAGGFVDRSRRRSILIGTDILRALVLATVPAAALLHWLTMPQLYAAAFIVGGASVLFDIADHAYLPTLVDREQLIDANARLSVTESLAEMGGPALAGVLVQLLTAPIAIAVNAATYLASAVFLAGIRRPEPPPPPPEAKPSLRADLIFGALIAMRQPLVRPIVISGAINALFGAFFQALYMVFAIRTLGFSPALLGLVIAMGGVGALGGALIFRPLIQRLGFGWAIIASAAFSALGVLLIPEASGPKWLAVAMMVTAQLVGDSFGVAMEIGTKSVQQAVLPGAALGRVGAVIQATTGAAGIVGALLGGFLAGPLGVRQTLVVAALGFLAAKIVLVLSPLRQLRELPTSAA